jgi:hypothetical protein
MKFYAELYGEEKSKEIANNIFLKVQLLESENVDLTNVGAIDEQFSHLKHQYRKLIDKYCKITYREGQTKMYVVRVFDMRQNPNKNR